MINQKLVDDNPDSIAQFLFSTEGLNSKQVGDLLSDPDPFAISILKAYLSAFYFLFYFFLFYFIFFYFIFFLFYFFFFFQMNRFTPNERK
jgi:hypothetical protein